MILIGTILEEFATMAHNTTKKMLFTGVLALSSAFVLASCDNISAVPANYETPIVVKGDQAYEDDTNKLGEIYDALASNKSEKVVSTLLEKLAEKEFGTFEEIEECFTVSGDAETIDETKAKAHIAKYAHEFVKEDDASIKEGVSAEEIQLARFKDFYKDLNERINKLVFDEISSDSYRDTINKTEFLEEKYARAKREDSYDIVGFEEDGSTTVNWMKRFIDNSFKEENVREYLTDFAVTYKDYVSKKLVPQIYKDKLVEEYIIENNYSALGRAYGRQINYVKISYSDDDPNTAYRLVENFTKNYLDDDARTSDAQVDYSELVSQVKGFEGIEENVVGDVTYPAIKPLAVSADLTTIYGEPKTLEAKCEKTGETFPIDLSNYGFGSSFQYYEKTKLGEILKNYEKAVVGEKTRFASSDDVSQFNSFTNNGKQSKEQGLMEKITNLALEDYANDGWFVKNDKDGSLSSLPDSIKNRIFNIKVSNDFDKADDEWTYVKGESYFNKLKGHAYLTPAENSDAEYNFILRDTSGKALYIVEILEAPSTSKLNKSSEKSYSKQEGETAYKTEAVARQIAKILGTKDTYTTNAYTSYLKLYTFVYHDTSVYEYLKSTYPDLFED